MVQTASDIMTSPAVTVDPTASLAEIASLLSAKQISAVPVCHADGTLAGMVSDGDILRPFRESVREKRDWWLGLIAEGEELSQDYLDYLRGDTRSAGEIMARSVVTADPDATLPQLAELMVAHGVTRIPILRNRRVIGIVSRSDLVAAIARTPATLV